MHGLLNRFIAVACVVCGTLNLGCYRSHERPLVDVDGGAVLDGAPDAPFPPDSGRIPCSATCDEPLVLARTRIEVDGPIFAVLGAAILGDTIGLLVLRSEASGEYFRYVAGIADLRRGTIVFENIGDVRTHESVVAGGMWVSDGGFHALVLSSESRDGAPLRVHTAQWTVAGSVREPVVVDDLTAELPTCRSCTRGGSIFGLSHRGAVFLGVGRTVTELLATVNGGIRVDANGPVMTLGEMTPSTIPMSGAMSGTDSLILVGGGTPTTPEPVIPVAAFATVGMPGAPLFATLLPGTRSDPPPVASGDSAGFTAYRFVSGSRGTGAIRALRFDRAGAMTTMPSLPTALGLAPVALAAASGDFPAVAWVERGPDATSGTLYALVGAATMWMDCAEVRPRAAASLPRLPREYRGIVASSLAISADARGVFVATLGVDGDFVLTLFHLPNCAIVRTEEPGR